MHVYIHVHIICKSIYIYMRDLWRAHLGVKRAHHATDPLIGGSLSFFLPITCLGLIAPKETQRYLHARVYIPRPLARQTFSPDPGCRGRRRRGDADGLGAQHLSAVAGGRCKGRTGVSEPSYFQTKTRLFFWIIPGNSSRVYSLHIGKWLNKPLVVWAVMGFVGPQFTLVSEQESVPSQVSFEFPLDFPLDSN